jgi:hypothetical protein
MEKVLSKIKSELSKDTITRKEIQNVLGMIDSYNTLRNSAPSPIIIWNKARELSCNTDFVEWYIINVLRKYT